MDHKIIDGKKLAQGIKDDIKIRVDKRKELGWAHFREPKGKAEQSFTKAGIADRIQWLPLGKPANSAV